MAGGDIQKHQFIRTGLAVTTSEFDRITGIAKADEIDALHHPSFGDIKAGNQAESDHGIRDMAVKVQPLSKPRRPCWEV